MAYLAYYNKYRPQSFDEVVGQKPIVATLRNALKEKKIAHAYLFCGPRGTGKTTMARLLAKALNCNTGIGNQCNKCESCELITKGEHPDVIEIDAASNSSVDAVRNLIDNVNYQPIMSRYKVYIIDEVHNMSNSAFNALLKTLEEPPSFVVFILATTEPQKILPTILSRVQRFDFSKVSDEDLIMNMENILKKEGISYDKEALQAVASLADGGVRDSLSLLDQLVSYSGEKVTLDDVNNLFGLLSKNDELKIVSLINDGKMDELIKLVRDKYSKGMDIVRLHSDLIAIYKDLIIYKATNDQSLLVKLNKDDCTKFDIPYQVLQRNITSLIESKREYKSADNVLSHFELSLLPLMISISTPTAQVVVQNPVKSNQVEEKELASKPVKITSDTASSSFIAKAKVEEKTDDSKIDYTFDDIINYMLIASKNPNSKNEKEELIGKWESLTLQFTSNYAFEAKALSNCNLKVVSNNVLIVSSDMITEIEKINKKSSRTALNKITKIAFGKEYDILPLAQNEYTEAVRAFVAKRKTGTLPDVYESKVDFGKKDKESNSTDFLNDIMNG